MSLLTTLFCLLFLLQLEPIENKKVLSILPLHTKSHYPIFERIFEALALKGYEIDLVTPLAITPTVPGINIIRTEYPDIYAVFRETPMDVMRNTKLYDVINFVFGGGLNICEECFKQEAFKKLRDTKTKYDLLILEVFVLDCLFGYAHALKTPVVAVTSSIDLPWGTNRIGNPDNPSYIVHYFTGLLPEMTLFERLANTISLVQVKLQQHWHHKQQEVEAKKMFGEDLPPLNDLIANISLFIVNSHFSLNQARPNVPNVIDAAGVHIKEPKPLKKSLSDFIGDSKFIYFSLGSMVKIENIPKQKLQYLCDIFRELKYKVLWKTDRSKLPKDLVVPGNVYTEAWMPQLDILCHPNILFFITHNGLMGTQEAVHCGVPMLSVPVFADQFLNAKNVAHKEVAIEIEIETVSKEELYTAIKELLQNPKYMQNAKRLSEQFKDRPRKPIEETVYWIEYVLKHDGAPQMRSIAAHLPWYQYYLLDVALILVAVVGVILSTLYIATRSIIKRFAGNVKQKQS